MANNLVKIDEHPTALGSHLAKREHGMVDIRLTRARIVVRGVVQGVGFRPFIYRLAGEYKLSGWVLNSTEGVIIEVEGSSVELEKFTSDITNRAPPLAVIEKIESSILPPIGHESFFIHTSKSREDKFVLISPDISVCTDCLKELFDPLDRRYLYPFINCTNCGPRFSIIKDIPYDRPKTTMSAFELCPECEHEYHNPADRRFHAQPNACPSCGPKVWLVSTKAPNSNIADGHEAIITAQYMLNEGVVIAIKGIGGFHLACDATNNSAVHLLRQRKNRVNKPFAVMAVSCKDVEEYCYVSQEEKSLLESPQRPIVLLRRRAGTPISDAVAPNNSQLGVMLPYAPLHYLLLEEMRKAINNPLLVMTSGNMSEEPIAIENKEALERLSTLADVFLLHDRDIHLRCDDTVTRVFDGKEALIRRSRGYAPFPVRLKFRAKQILACGSELKNVFCATRDNYAFLSQHIGDMQNLETLNSFKSGVEHFKNVFRISPEVIAYDLHPEYLTTKYAMGLYQAEAKQAANKLKFVAVQHHHAHIASCMAENGLHEAVIGIAFDGTGYGDDGQIWGGEFLVADYKQYKRRAHFKYVPLPGGDNAIRKPYRMALSYLDELPKASIKDLDISDRIDPLELSIVKKQIENRINSPLTSSCGRFFDAVSSLLGVCDVNGYEGEAAIDLEMLADENYEGKYFWPISASKFPVIINHNPVLYDIICDLRIGVPVTIISAKFHNTVAAMISEVCGLIRDKDGLNQVALSGGVFQNIYLLKRAISLLKDAGFDVYVHNQVPCNDGGIALGQAVIANAMVTEY
jgi:hydrogenase maturation protein HypF